MVAQKQHLRCAICFCVNKRVLMCVYLSFRQHSSKKEIQTSGQKVFRITNKNNPAMKESVKLIEISLAICIIEVSIIKPPSGSKLIGLNS